MAAPLRGTQSLVGQMGWVFERPLLTLIEVAWRWLFGVPLLAVCWFEARKILAALPLDSAGLANLDPQNPWVAAVQLSDAWILYQPHVVAVLRWLLPAAALAWVVISGVGRCLDGRLPRARCSRLADLRGGRRWLCRIHPADGRLLGRVSGSRWARCAGVPERATDSPSRG